MEQSPSWEANSHKASQEIPHLLRNPKVHYRVHKSPPLGHILSQMNPANTFPSSYLSKVHFNIILPLLLTSLKLNICLASLIFRLFVLASNVIIRPVTSLHMFCNVQHLICDWILICFILSSGFSIYILVKVNLKLWFS